MEMRIKMRCWNADCRREYSLYKKLNVDEQPKLIVECPFCEREGVVDLAPYRSEVVRVFESIGQESKIVGEALVLPDVLPTSEPGE